jgi:hypothetical protein
MRSRISRALSGRRQGPWILASALLVALLVAPFAGAFGEGQSVRGGARNPSNNASLAYTKETQIIANVSTYGTRQSNKSDNGGGAVYGCRSKAGGTPKGNRPCIRASNLADGRAFEFNSSGGTEVGAITSSNANAAPFTTNAGGVATGLNADKVDGKDAADLQGQFASVTATGTLAAARGATAAAREGVGQYLVTFGADISKCVYNVTVIGGEGALGFGSVEPVGGTQLRVRTRQAAADNPAADRAFHLLVTC